MKWQQLAHNDPWLRVGDAWNTGSFLGNKSAGITGKYLFFSPDQDLLIEIIEDEITNHGFSSAKVIQEPKGDDYVACLYWRDDSRKYELAERHKNTPNLKYRYWKSDADTRAGKYSKEFLTTPTKDKGGEKWIIVNTTAMATVVMGDPNWLTLN